MPDFESEIAAQLRRQAEALPIDDQMRDRLVWRVRTHQRRRAVLVSAPVAAALFLPSAGHRSRPRASAAAATHGGPSWQRLADPCGSLPGQQLSAVDASHLWLACGSEPAGSLQAKPVCFSADAVS